MSVEARSDSDTITQLRAVAAELERVSSRLEERVHEMAVELRSEISSEQTPEGVLAFGGSDDNVVTWPCMTPVTVDTTPATPSEAVVEKGRRSWGVNHRELA